MVKRGDVMIYDGALRDSTNKRSDKYLHINSCNVQRVEKRGGTVIRKHGRVDYHVLYVARGECVCLYGGEDVSLKRGDFVIYPPDTEQRYSFCENMDVMTMWVHFSGFGVEEIFSELGLVGGVFSAASPTEVEHYFRKMINVSSPGLPQYRVRAVGYLLNLLASLAASKNSCSSAAYSGEVGEMLGYLNLNWQKDPSVSELASLVNLSESRAAHLFKESVGVSIHRYLNGIKMSNARELLENTELSVSEISAMVGFEDPLYFSRFFKSFSGLSPKNYRNSKRDD